MKLFQLLFVLPILIASISNNIYCQEYNFPIKPGSNDWKKLQTYDEMVQACQIPDSILLKIPTKDLMESCLKYPLLLSFLDYHDNKFGFETMCNKFNGFHEFFKRKDAGKYLLEKYRSIIEEVIVNDTIPSYKGHETFRFSVIELSLTDDNVLSNLNTSDKMLLLKEAMMGYEMKMRHKEIYGLFAQMTSVFLSVTLLNTKESKDWDLYITNNVEVKSFSEKISVAYNSLVQSSDEIYTPKGSLVTDTRCFTSEPLTGPEIDTLNAKKCRLFPDATLLADASGMYNCHGYAWHLSEGAGQPVWIGWRTRIAHYKYWEDGSYIETNYHLYPARVCYVEGNHSAVATNHPDTVISKWGNGPLMRHHKNCCEYNSNTLKYYIKNPYITGPSMVCTSDSVFTVNNLYNGSTINWSVSSGMLQLISSSGNSAVFRGLPNASGIGIIQATITTPFGVVFTKTHQVWVGVPSIIGITGLSSNLVGGSSTYTAHLTNVRAIVTSYNWSLMPGVYNNYFAQNGHTCGIAWYTAGYYALAVNAQNTCGSGNSYYFPISIFNRGLRLSPNPARDNVQVSVTQAQNTSSISNNTSIIPELKTFNDQDISTTYTIKIYNTFGKVFYSDVKTGDSFTIPVSNLQEGTYIVEVSDGKNSYSRQLVVKH